MTCYDWYKDLVYYIQGSSAAVLSNDSSNILSLIKEEYEVSRISIYFLKFNLKILGQYILIINIIIFWQNFIF